MIWITTPISLPKQPASWIYSELLSRINLDKINFQHLVFLHFISKFQDQYSKTITLQKHIIERKWFGRLAFIYMTEVLVHFHLVCSEIDLDTFSFRGYCLCIVTPGAKGEFRERVLPIYGPSFQYFNIKNIEGLKRHT